jgi:hypothetical protein
VGCNVLVEQARSRQSMDRQTLKDNKNATGFGWRTDLGQARKSWFHGSRSIVSISKRFTA